MPSTSAHSDPSPVTLWHYDGATALRRTPTIAVEGDHFRLDDGAPISFADLMFRERVGGDVVYGRKGHPGWRIGFSGEVPVKIAARLPSDKRYGGVIDRCGLWPAAAVFAVLATIAIILFLRTPAVIARVVPPSIERRLGDLMVGDFGNRSCSGPGGAEALSTLVDRIDPDDATVEVHVVNLPIVNAVTLPGGRIVLFDGLVRAAKSPDEVAGVLAHEIGHVRHRDVMESLLRQLGLSVLLGGLEGNIGGYTNTLLAATYSRGAEERADGYALSALSQAQISPAPTAAFFRRLAKSEGGGGTPRIINYLSTHPISSDRAARFAKAAQGQTATRPALSSEQWLRLRAICASDRQVEKPEFRF